MKTVSMLIFALLGTSGVSASQIRAVDTEIVDLDAATMTACDEDCESSVRQGLRRTTSPAVQTSPLPLRQIASKCMNEKYYLVVVQL